jgi:hypothetical protein
MSFPQTVKGWLTAAASAAALAGTLAAGGWWFVQQNAWARDVNYVVQSVETLRCDILNQKIRELEAKQANDNLSPREQAWLQELLRQWDRFCVEGS